MAFKIDISLDRNVSFLNDNSIYSSLKWNIPGKDNISCIGGLEKDPLTGNVSHDPNIHSLMVDKRLKKIINLINYIPDISVIGASSGNVLIITWGSVFGIIRSLYDEMNESFSLICLRHLNPFPKNLNCVIKSFKKIIVTEENNSQLSFILRSNYNIDIISINQVTGKPFDRVFLKNKILDVL
jgi:2-oxoglutarate ferredoxin oxidoreductase subunit alpha